MSSTDSAAQNTEPLVELAPEESVLRAMAQSAHPVEFIASNEPAEAELGDA